MYFLYFCRIFSHGTHFSGYLYSFRFTSQWQVEIISCISSVLLILLSCFLIFPSLSLSFLDLKYYYPSPLQLCNLSLDISSSLFSPNFYPLFCVAPHILPIHPFLLSISMKTSLVFFHSLRNPLAFCMLQV